MNFIRRWRHGAERHQEQLLVKLWTINSLDADNHTQTSQLTPKLALAAPSTKNPRSPAGTADPADFDDRIPLTRELGRLLFCGRR